MKDLCCACLVAEDLGTLLLVRVRDNEHWYLPGGKIETNESPEQTLERELLEELGILIDPESVRFLYIVHGPAYGQPGDVELVCFSAQWVGEPRPRGEISEVRWLDFQDMDKFAPAVQMLCSQYLGGKSE